MLKNAYTPNGELNTANYTPHFVQCKLLADVQQMCWTHSSYTGNCNRGECYGPTIHPPLQNQDIRKAEKHCAETNTGVQAQSLILWLSDKPPLSLLSVAGIAKFRNIPSGLPSFSATLRWLIVLDDACIRRPWAPSWFQGGCLLSWRWLGNTSTSRLDGVCRWGNRYTRLFCLQTDTYMTDTHVYFAFRLAHTWLLHRSILPSHWQIYDWYTRHYFAFHWHNIVSTTWNALGHSSENAIHKLRDLT